MSRAKCKPINRDALYSEIYKRKKTLGEVSEAIGHARNYIANSSAKGYLAESTIKLLESTEGIKAEKYVVDDEKQEKPEPQIVDDGKNVKNINVEFIRFRAHEIGLPLKSFCDVMGKKDNYLNSIRTNGATKEEISRIAMILRIDENEERLFIKPKKTEPPKDNLEAVKERLNKLEAKIAQQATQIGELKAQNSEMRMQITVQQKLAGSIIGTLTRHNIHVGKN